MDELDQIFWAESVAVIGASKNPSKLGHIILRNLLEGGFGGEIFPVNLSGGNILGLPVYRNLAEIPNPIDIAIFVIPARFVPEMIEAAAEKEAKGAVVISGGFREAGNDLLEADLVQKAKEHGVRVIGPNCQGFNFIPNKLCASWPLITSEGPVAVISQSGTVAAALAGWLQDDEIGCSGVVSLGNQADLCETDFLDFFIRDPSTKVITMYIEGVKEGRRFLEVAQSSPKPILVLKSGRTPGGKKAAMTHTRSLMGKDTVFTGVCQQAGLVRVSTVEELYDFAKGMVRIPPASGKRIMVVSSSGGAGILAVDKAESLDLEIPILQSEDKDVFPKEELPPNMIINNPLDLTGDALADHFQKVVKICSSRNLADAYLLIFGDPIPGAADAVEGLKAHLDETFCVCYLGGGEVEKTEVKKMNRYGIPVYATPERAVSALAETLTWAKEQSVNKERMDK